jgi:hypothetical protein
MPKQPNPPRRKIKRPAIKRPKPPSTPLFNGIFPMVSPEMFQPSTNSKPSFNRQAGEQPNLNPAREVFRRSHDRIMAPCAPKTQQVSTRSAVAAFTEKMLFEKLLTEQQEEIGRLSKELAAEKEENAELKAKLAASQALPSKKRKRLGGRLYDLDDWGIVSGASIIRRTVGRGFAVIMRLEGLLNQADCTLRLGKISDDWREDFVSGIAKHKSENAIGKWRLWSGCFQKP